MGVLSSVRAVRWARKRQPDEIAYWIALSRVTKQIIASSDPEHHVKRIKLLQKLGATTVVLMNRSGGDPHAAIRVYGESVLPELR